MVRSPAGDAFQILPSGRVRAAKINTLTLVIHEGAFYEGQPRHGHTGATPRKRTS